MRKVVKIILENGEVKQLTATQGLGELEALKIINHLWETVHYLKKATRMRRGR